MIIANFNNSIMARKLKTWKMRHKHSMTWNMARKLTNEENEKIHGRT